jgi:hypothetical protein
MARVSGIKARIVTSGFGYPIVPARVSHPNPAAHWRPGRPILTRRRPQAGKSAYPFELTKHQGQALRLSGEIDFMAYGTEDIRNIALVGHATSGKTTLVEALLEAAGVIQAAGDVARGNTVCDFDPLEKEKGHSLDTALVSFD